jgi:hypothetical protein
MNYVSISGADLRVSSDEGLVSYLAEEGTRGQGLESYLAEEGNLDLPQGERVKFSAVPKQLINVLGLLVTTGIESASTLPLSSGFQGFRV